MAKVTGIGHMSYTVMDIDKSLHFYCDLLGGKLLTAAILAGLDSKNEPIRSAAEAIGEMKNRGCKHIKLMVLVAAPEGIEHIQKLYPDVDIYAGALDDHLNEHGYIVPGLGDAGDRIFGTK